jgi:hypothetical protein
MRAILVSFLLYSLSPVGIGQTPAADWFLQFDGTNDSYLADIALDTEGNTYLAINYTMELSLPSLGITLPYAPHVHAVIIKIDKKGKTLWAHAFKSANDNRVKDLSIGANGNLLITGFGDGLMLFPGKKDTLKAGIAPQTSNFHIRHSQGFYLASYTPLGDRAWVQYYNCGWGEGMSIATNSKNETCLAFYHRGNISQKDILIDSFTNQSKEEYKISLAFYNPSGDLVHIKNLNYSNSAALTNVKYDRDDNLIVYGSFKSKIKFSANDSLTNDSYHEGGDSYIAKFDPKGAFLWVQKMGGRNGQQIRDIAIAADQSIYAVGEYSFECIIGTGIDRVIQSKYEWKSGSNMFYLHLFADGELDFARFETNKGYNSTVNGSHIALDANGRSHIIGNFNDTLRLHGFSIATGHHNNNGFYSVWCKDSLSSLDKVGAARVFIYARKNEIVNERYVVAGEYYGEGAYLWLQGKEIALKNNKKFRAIYLWGGAVPFDKNLPEFSVQQDTNRAQRMQKMAPLLACDASENETSSDKWFTNPDSLGKNDLAQPATFPNSPCGETLTGIEASLYPNPSSELLNIQLKGLKGKTQLHIYNANGGLLLSQQIDESAQEQLLSFSVSQLSAGTYYVQIYHKQYQKILRFVKI